MVLTPGKGWVLAMLAMLAAKRRLCVAARGSGPAQERALALRCAPCPPGRRQDEERPRRYAAVRPRPPGGVELRADVR
jgi:hypothetical protein